MLKPGTLVFIALLLIAVGLALTHLRNRRK
jgi:hypothetical protein